VGEGEVSGGSEKLVERVKRVESRESRVQSRAIVGDIQYKRLTPLRI
jgi:hypothetical protein